MTKQIRWDKSLSKDELNAWRQAGARTRRAAFGVLCPVVIRKGLDIDKSMTHLSDSLNSRDFARANTTKVKETRVGRDLLFRACLMVLYAAAVGKKCVAAQSLS